MNYTYYNNPFVLFETNLPQHDILADCPPSNIISTNASNNSLWQVSPDIALFKLQYGWQVAHQLSVQTPVVTFNNAAERILNNFVQPDITNATILQSFRTKNQQEKRILNKFIRSGVLAPVKRIKDISNTKPSTLVTWMHLTDRCNLKCAYCYLPHVREDMSVEIGKASIEAAFRSAIAHDYQKITFKYAGGEPLIQFPLLVELHRYAHKLAKQYQLDLEGVVLSNGTLLTKEMVSTLLSLEIKLVISMDGLDEAHDLQRPFASGSDSSYYVKKAISTAVENDLIPGISIVISGRNAQNLSSFVSWIINQDLPFSFNFYRENSFSVRHQDLRFEEKKIITGILAAYKIIEEYLPNRSLLMSLVDRGNLSTPHKQTCAVGHSYLVFNQNGQVSKCQMQMDIPITNIHVDDPLKAVRSDNTGIQNLSVDDKDECRTCPWKYYCTGGCPLMTYRATGRYNVKSPNCNIYKAIYPEAIRLEGLRLLKYAHKAT